MPGADMHNDDDWYDEPRGDLDVDGVRRRAAALGPKFEQLADAVMGEMCCAHENRDRVRASLIECRDRFVRGKIVSADVRDWLTRVDKRATALANLLERNPFPKGSAQAEFGFVYEDIELPSADDIAHLRKMANAAENVINAWRKRGAPRRHDRDDLIRDLADVFKIFASKRATVTNEFHDVVAHVLEFVEGRRPKVDTVTGIIKRALKTRRSGSKKTA